MAAIIGVQDSLQHVGPQLWFLQSLLGNITAVIHTLAYRSLRHVSPHNPGLMHYYIAGHAQYAATTALEAGSCHTPACQCALFAKLAPAATAGVHTDAWAVLRSCINSVSCAAGSRQEFEHMERIVRPFVDIQALLHEMLATLQLLRCSYICCVA